MNTKFLPKNIFVTGPPRSGKSTLIMSISKELLDKGIQVGGIICPEIRIGGRRWGFKVIVYPGGPEEILASITIKSPHRVSKYGVNVQGFEKIVEDHLNKMLTDPKTKVLLIDEIGKMELLSKKFEEFVKKALNTQKPIIGVIGRVNHPLILTIQKRKDTKIYTITRGTTTTQKQRIKQQILNTILEYLRRTNKTTKPTNKPQKQTFKIHKHNN